MTPDARETRLLEIAKATFDRSDADETEVLVSEGRSFLTRFSGNRIHQNVGTEDAGAIVRVVVGKRTGVATASSLEPESLDEALKAARTIAMASEPLPRWPGLPAPQPVPEVEAWDEETAAASPGGRADMAGAIIAAAEAKDGEAAGAVETEDESLAIASTAGVAAAFSRTRASLRTVVAAGDGSGYAEGVSRRIADLDAGAVGRRAAGKADASRAPQALPPGRYDVVLEPPAIAEWLEYLAYVAFGGKDFDEGRSPVSGRLGEKVSGERVTLWDDSLDGRTLPMPFDYEGTPKRRLALIEGGVAKGVATNHYRARRLGHEASTGHALPASSSYECFPMHLFMAGGESSAAKLVKEMERGLLVTRFHYTNILDRLRTVLTGMTRDGTFLVEDGEVVGPVKNFRYTENVLEALGRIDDMSEELTLVRGPVVVPTVRIREVQFSGATEF
jgi:predicted Zn-dependent protease